MAAGCVRYVACRAGKGLALLLIRRRLLRLRVLQGVGRLDASGMMEDLAGKLAAQGTAVGSVVSTGGLKTMSVEPGMPAHRFTARLRSLAVRHR